MIVHPVGLIRFSMSPDDVRDDLFGPYLIFYWRGGNMPDIKNLGENVYLVGRKVVCVKDNAFDPDTPEGEARLVDYAGAMDSPLYPKAYGELTAGAIYPKDSRSGDDMYLAEPMSFAEFSDGVRDQLRKEFPEYADRI